jgi:hypothetical protein
MKSSLKNLAREIAPERPAPTTVKTSEDAPSYPTAQTREGTRQISGHYPADEVQAFRILAAEQDKDVQELLAEAMNMIFERYGRGNRVPVTSGRRTKARR